MSTHRVYLDYAASTPVDPAVERAMRPYFGKIFGNPSSLHRFGQEASAAVFAARQKIAKSLNIAYQQIIFTGSATEANSLAIRGTVKTFLKKQRLKGRPRIITTTIEHHSVLEVFRDLERDGIETIYIPVSKDGVVDPDKISKALNERTILVSVMSANNEIGTIQPISDIAEKIKSFRSRNPGTYPLFHSDAAQAFQFLNCQPRKLGVDLLTISGQKIYGPKGIGALFAASPKLLAPVIIEGGQEFGVRSGTENVPYIVGFAKAVEIADRLRAKESERVSKLRAYFWAHLKKVLPKLELNGSLVKRLPNNLNIYFPGWRSHDLLIDLDLLGVATSPGAACASRVTKSSFVLEALGFPEERASGSLRFSLGRQTTKAEVDYTIKSILKTVA